MKFYGAVGYASTQESTPGVWVDVITEVMYFGDVVRNSRRLAPSQVQLNDNLAVSNSISIMADAYAYENFAKMRYVEWNGSKWKVDSVDDQRPRLVLSLGELWNGNTA